MNINEVLPDSFLLCMAMLLGVERQFAGVQGTTGSQIASSVPLWVVGYIGEYTKDSLFPLKKHTPENYIEPSIGPLKTSLPSLCIK